MSLGEGWVDMFRLMALPCGCKAESGGGTTGEAADDGSADILRTKLIFDSPLSRRGRFLSEESPSSMESLRLRGGSNETARGGWLAALSPGAVAITSPTFGCRS
jgi:hypothetical protein